MCRTDSDFVPVNMQKVTLTMFGNGHYAETSQKECLAWDLF